MIKKAIVIICIFTALSCYQTENPNKKLMIETINIMNQSKKNIKDLNELKKWCAFGIQKAIDLSEMETIINYFCQSAALEPTSSYRSYLYFIVSDIYWNRHNNDSALFYMAKVEENDYELDYQGEALGYILALRIIKSEANAELKIKMYDRLCSKYSDKIDLVYTLSEYANLYKKQFDMKNAVIQMEKIVKLSSSNKEEIPNLNEIKKEIKYYYLKKEWIYQDLSILIDNIKSAVKNRNFENLRNLASKEDFELIVFQNENKHNLSLNQLRFSKYWSETITFESKFEEFSNENEVFLKSDNWKFFNMKTWYFYFKKVNYPYDLTINGGWEWKGIYFGRLF